MSNTGEIGVRISLVGGRVAAVEAETVAKAVKGIGDAAVESDAKARVTASASGGMSLLARGFGGINRQIASTGSLIRTVGTNAASLGVEGAGGLTAFGSHLSETSSKANTLLGQMATLGKYTLVGVAAGTAAATYEFAKMGAEFQGTTGMIAASANISVQSADQIGRAFLATSGTASYSAQQLGSAYALVAGQLGDVAGHALNSTEAVGFMTAAWHTAEASGQDLSSTTRDLSTTLQTYNMGINQASTASDLLYNTAKLTGNSIDALSTAEDNLHGRIQEAMPSLQDMSGFTLDLSEHGVRGSRGIRAVSQAFSTLLSGGKPVNDMLSALGVNVFDASGHFVGMDNLLRQLTPKFAALSPQMQLLAARTLFGAGAEEQMMAVVQGGAGAFDAATQAVSAHNSVQDAAEKKLSTSQGRWEVLTAEAKNFAVEAGLHVIPILETLGEKLMGVVHWLGAHKDAAIVLAGVIGGVLSAAIGAFIYTKAVALIGTLGEMADGAIILAGKFFGVGPAAAAAELGIEGEEGVAATAIATNDALAAAKFGVAGALEAEAGAASAAAGALEAEAGAAAGGAGMVATESGLLVPRGATEPAPTSAPEGAPSSGGVATTGAGVASKVIGRASFVLTMGQLLSGDKNPEIDIFNKAEKDLPGLERQAGGVKPLVHDILAQIGHKPSKGTYADELLRIIGPRTVVPIGKQMHIPGFQFGGIVPGPIGSPQLILAHGGEEVSNPGQQAPIQLTAQLVVDRQVLAESVLEFIGDQAVRTG